MRLYHISQTLKLGGALSPGHQKLSDLAEPFLQGLERGPDCFCAMLLNGQYMFAVMKRSGLREWADYAKWATEGLFEYVRRRSFPEAVSRLTCTYYYDNLADCRRLYEEDWGGEIPEEREKVRHTVLVEDGTLKVLVSDERAWYDHLTLFSSRPSVTVYLPSDRFTALTVTTDTGDVSVPAAFAFGNAEIATDTGNVSFDASVDGNLKIKTKTGDVRLEGVRAGLIDLSTSTGKIDGGNVTCEWTFSVKVSTGKTVLTDVTCHSLISTGSTGDLTLKNTTATNDLNLKRDTGDVRFEACDAGQITVVTSTGDVSGTFRSEKTFAVKTSTGKVRVPDGSSGGRCGITTSTGDVTIDLIRY